MHDDILAAFDLSDRVAVVTGAASGIGRGTAVTLAKAGASVVLADIDADGMGETGGELDALGAAWSTVPTDVSDKAAVDALVADALQRHGRLDIMVNNAGIITDSLMVDTTPEQLDRVVNVNLKGVYWGTAAAGRAMADQQSGSIVNLSSAGADMPAPMISVYALTKAAVKMITRTAAVEMAPIRVNAVAPGSIETPIYDRHFLGADGKVDPERQRAHFDNIAGLNPLGFVGDPSDIAYAILYLCSDAGRFVTGQTVRPNGGVVMPL
ncbi:SDR family NAD(P)-dependent oxidoreductase [Candidatus Poriferisocius sp.]|uniref:SDR family NAD(P)-dependent oxidoreductase n=1 Tax=Candidatus Poriferisocius sp. TaxID=3101276 RepID=UPI003B590892